MPTKYIVSILALIVVAVGLLIGASLVDPKELTAPISVDRANAFADGGSMEVHLTGANGKKLVILREGSLQVARSQQPMYIVNDVIGLLPIRRTVDRHSPSGEEARRLLELWLKERLTAEQRSRIVANDQAALREIPLQTIIVFDMVRWIEEK